MVFSFGEAGVDKKMSVFFRDRNAKIHLAKRGECKNPSAS